MSVPPGSTIRSGKAWLVFLAIPPLIVIGGLIALFVWQGSKGGITPKWRKPAPTNSIAPPSAPR